MLKAFDEVKSANQWEKDPRCTVRAQTVRARLRSGWSEQDAIEIGSTLKRGLLIQIEVLERFKSTLRPKEDISAAIERLIEEEIKRRSAQ